MGAGGLLAEIPSRPQPARRRRGGRRRAAAGAAVAVLVLAAGRSTRMGGPNKMLADANGQPLVVHAVKAALASQAVEIVVVLDTWPTKSVPPSRSRAGQVAPSLVENRISRGPQHLGAHRHRRAQH